MATTFSRFLAEHKVKHGYARIRYGTSAIQPTSYRVGGGGPSGWDNPNTRFLGPGSYDFGSGGGASRNPISAARGNTQGGGDRSGWSRSGISNQDQGTVALGLTPEQAEQLEGARFSLRLPTKTLTGSANQIMAQIYDLGQGDVTALQQMLWKGFLYTPDMYANGVEPGWGSLFDDGATKAALQTILLESASSGKSLNQVLDERASTYESDVANAGREAVEAVDPQYIHNPERIITLPDPDEIASNADQIAFTALGRKATPEEKLILIQMVHAQLRLLQTQAAQSEQNNLLGSALAQAGQAGYLIAPGQTGGYTSAGPMGGGGGGGPIVHPVKGMKIEFSDTGDFGPRRKPSPGASSYHRGVDIGAAGGTPIVSASSGTVLRVDRNAGTAGNQVYIKDAQGRIFKYLHMNAKDFGVVRVGQQVQAGQMIGRVGSTGESTGNHLHFAVMINGDHVDPEPILRAGSLPAGGGGGGGSAASWLRAAAAYGMPASPTGGGNDRIGQLMHGLKMIENSGRYDWQTSNPGYHGAYQFDDPTWKGAARAAGLNPNDHSPVNQDRVMRHRMGYLLRKYNGNERLALAAHHGGEGYANRFVNNPAGLYSHGDKNIDTGSYADKILAEANKAPGGGGGGMGMGMGAGAPGQVNQEYGESTQDWNLRLIEQVDYNQQASIEAELRRRNPGLAGAHDTVVHGYDVLEQMFSAPVVNDQ
jgi:murein DD-endopeptidase MepM/ murein hydrolase activator NlpD